MIEFDPRHSQSLSIQANELLAGVKAVAAPVRPPTVPVANPIHPVFTVTAQALAGIPSFRETVVNAHGEEVGRFWIESGKRVGWDGEVYQRIKALAMDLAIRKPMAGLVSISFVLDEIFAWLMDALRGIDAGTLAERLETRCEAEVKEIEIWVPIFQTHSKDSFTIGPVTFKTITKDMMDAWYNRGDTSGKPEVKAALNRERSKFQATLAACSTVCAEPKRASEVVFERIGDAISLLRFLSEFNWTCNARSYVVPVGLERDNLFHELIVSEGMITQTIARSIRTGRAGWNVDQNRACFPGLLEQLDSLASNPTETKMRKALFEALLIYSKNNLTSDPAEKLVFVLVSLESLLLRDGNEGIQGNLAERLAFLVGPTLDDRKQIVAVTRKTYALRSKFVHHGRAIEDMTSLEQFLGYAWQALANILAQMDSFESREALIAALDERRLS